jgi:hypothetical protein
MQKKESKAIKGSEPREPDENARDGSAGECNGGREDFGHAVRLCREAVCNMGRWKKNHGLTNGERHHD